MPSSRPLKILVHPSLLSDEVNLLAEKGHVIHCMGQPTEYDLILGPNCWRAEDTSMLDVTIKAARRAKYDR